MIIESQTNQNNTQQTNTNMERFYIEKYRIHLETISFLVICVLLIPANIVACKYVSMYMLLIFIPCYCVFLFFAVFFAFWPSIFIVECIPSEKVVIYSAYGGFKWCGCRITIKKIRMNFADLFGVVPYNDICEHGLIFTFNSARTEGTIVGFREVDVNSFAEKVKQLLVPYMINRIFFNNNQTNANTQQPPNVQGRTVAMTNRA